MTEDYVRFAAELAGYRGGACRVVADAGNGTAGLLWEAVENVLGIRPIRMNFEPDGRFPAHSPDPTDPANLADLCARVQSEGADIGFAHDGDADRVVAVMDDGRILDGADVSAALIAHEAESGRAGPFALNMVSSRKALDYVRDRGIETLIVPVGHGKIKRFLRDRPDVVFAGEQSGHYFYPRFFCSESSVITTLRLMDMAASGRLHDVVDTLGGPWHAPTREPVLHFTDRSAAVACARHMARAALERWDGPVEIMVEDDWQIVRRAAIERIDGSDGVRVDYDDWWFAVRPSETEPRLRLALEARDPGRVASLTKALLGFADEFLSLEGNP